VSEDHLDLQSDDVKRCCLS